MDLSNVLFIYIYCTVFFLSIVRKYADLYTLIFHAQYCYKFVTLI